MLIDTESRNVKLTFDSARPRVPVGFVGPADVRAVLRKRSRPSFEWLLWRPIQCEKSQIRFPELTCNFFS